jgi:hypothetical protein
MKIAAIYNVWADCMDLLPYSIGNIFPVVDGVIVVWSAWSNQGVFKDDCIHYSRKPHNEKISFHNYEPELPGTPHQNETNKRNEGLRIAREQGYTHFIMMDADEFYNRGEFKYYKKLTEDEDLNGSVCRTKVYFKKPTLTIGYDHTLVPFIHKLSPGLRFGNFKDYPCAYDEAGNAHIDPTRRLNITKGIASIGVTMHHYSWVRSDYNLKIENSAAKNNLKKSSIYRDLENAKDGVYNEFYRATLVSCDNYFNLPEL